MKKIKFEYANFNELERIRVYLEIHPEVFTEEFMEELAERFLNYNNVRKKIKELYPRILKADLDVVNIIPSDYEKAFKKKDKEV
jgi:hypothetical protein